MLRETLFCEFCGFCGRLFFADSAGNYFLRILRILRETQFCGKCIPREKNFNEQATFLSSLYLMGNNMSEAHEYQLVRGILKGDAHCEEALYRRYQAPMYRVCLRYARDRQEAEDMLQEGFLRVFSDLKQFRFEGSLEGWMRRVIVRAALRVIRQRRETGPFDPETSERTEDPAPLEEAETQEVHLMLQRLPEGYRMVLNLHVLEGFSHEEIATMLGISAGTSRSQLSKARALLRKMMTAKTTT